MMAAKRVPIGVGFSTTRDMEHPSDPCATWPLISQGQGDRVASMGMEFPETAEQADDSYRELRR